MLPSSSTRLLLLAALGAAACARPGAKPPEEEFLVAAGDSTYWVRSGPSGVRVRGAPIMLARIEGRFHELYVTDDDRSFENAIFVSPRVFRRDLVTGDSTLVWRDSTFDGVVKAYAERNPDERVLEPDDESPEEPRVSNSAELGALELHGPYLSYEYHTDVDADDAPAWHETRRGVVDLRTGRASSVASLFGDTAATRVLRLGRRAYLAALDSVIADRSEGGRRAARSLGDFHFDPASFALADLDGAPAVAFHAPGRGDGTSGGVTLPIAPIQVGEPSWWRSSVRPELPSVTEAGHERWTRGPRALEARYDSVASSAELVLTQGGHEWRVARVGVPVYRVHWIGGALDSLGRRRLVRAFDEAASYDEEVRMVAHPRRPRPGAARLVAGARRPPLSRAAARRAPHAPRS